MDNNFTKTKLTFMEDSDLMIASPQSFSANAFALFLQNEVINLLSDEFDHKEEPFIFFYNRIEKDFDHFIKLCYSYIHHLFYKKNFSLHTSVEFTVSQDFRSISVYFPLISYTEKPSEPVSLLLDGSNLDAFISDLEGLVDSLIEADVETDETIFSSRPDQDEEDPFLSPEEDEKGVDLAFETEDSSLKPFYVHKSFSDKEITDSQYDDNSNLTYKTASFIHSFFNTGKKKTETDLIYFAKLVSNHIDVFYYEVFKRKDDYKILFTYFIDQEYPDVQLEVFDMKDNYLFGLSFYFYDLNDIEALASFLEDVNSDVVFMGEMFLVNSSLSVPEPGYEEYGEPYHTHSYVPNQTNECNIALDSSKVIDHILYFCNRGRKERALQFFTSLVSDHIDAFYESRYKHRYHYSVDFIHYSEYEKEDVLLYAYDADKRYLFDLSFFVDDLLDKDHLSFFFEKLQSSVLFMGEKLMGQDLSRPLMPDKAPDENTEDAPYLVFEGFYTHTEHFYYLESAGTKEKLYQSVLNLLNHNRFDKHKIDKIFNFIGIYVQAYYEEVMPKKEVFFLEFYLNSAEFSVVARVNGMKPKVIHSQSLIDLEDPDEFDKFISRITSWIQPPQPLSEDEERPSASSRPVIPNLDEKLQYGSYVTHKELFYQEILYYMVEYLDKRGLIEDRDVSAYQVERILNPVFDTQQDTLMYDELSQALPKAFEGLLASRFGRLINYESKAISSLKVYQDEVRFTYVIESFSPIVFSADLYSFSKEGYLEERFSAFFFDIENEVLS